MKRTTISLEPELEPVKAPPGAGAFASGRKQTAGKAEGLLRKLRFGRES